MRKLIFVFSVVFLMSCSKDNESDIFNEMKADRVLADSFTEKELKGLAHIVDFFESQVCSENEKNTAQCYLKLNNQLIADYSKNGNVLKLPIDYAAQQQLYTEIDPALFNEIWYRIKKENARDIRMTKYYRLNFLGKYDKFLKRAGRDNTYIKKYADVFDVSKSVSYPLYVYNLSQVKLSDYKDVKMRLLISIHYLTIKEQQEFYLKLK